MEWTYNPELEAVINLKKNLNNLKAEPKLEVGWSG